jgi:hypothetical protein
MMVDLSHVSHAVMVDAINVSVAPVVFSHSSAFAICNHHRNVRDDILQLMVRRPLSPLLILLLLSPFSALPSSFYDFFSVLLVQYSEEWHCYELLIICIDIVPFVLFVTWLLTQFVSKQESNYYYYYYYYYLSPLCRLFTIMDLKYRLSIVY